MKQLTLTMAKIMDQSDIKYIIEVITEGIVNEDWDSIEEAKEILKEFIDGGDSQLEE
jgi:hypothetical protein